jgi:predicted nucleic acid-binding protein
LTCERSRPANSAHAATAIEADATLVTLAALVTLDRDFARFTGLKWMSPLAPT